MTVGQLLIDLANDQGLIPVEKVSKVPVLDDAGICHLLVYGGGTDPITFILPCGRFPAGTDPKPMTVGTQVTCIICLAAEA